MATTGKMTDEQLETLQNTDPVSDPADSPTVDSSSSDPITSPEMVMSGENALEEIERLKGERERG